MVFEDLNTINNLLFSIILLLFIIVFIMAIFNKFLDSRSDLNELYDDIKTYKKKGFKNIKDYLEYKKDIIKIIKNYERNKVGDTFNKFTKSIVINICRGALLGACLTRTISGTIINTFLSCIIVTIIDFSYLIL